jgi:glucose/arabinose dehydrogenase
MAIATSDVSASELRRFTVPARPRVNPSEVSVPEGYTVEVVVVGLSFPTGMGFGDDGTLYILEGGSVWPTRPALPPRILRLDRDRRLDAVAEEGLGGPRGVAVHEGHLYVSAKGDYHSRITRYELDGSNPTCVVDGLPDGGWHEPGGPVFGPDGLMYFGQGSVSQNGVVLPHGFMVDLARHATAHDVPGVDVTLTGNDVDTEDPTAPYPFIVHTGAFKPFGTPSQPGEVIKGRLKCSSGIWRSRPDGSDMELLAWGVRNPYGMAISSDGELYVSDNDFEEKGERAIKGDPDRVWHIAKASTPHGSVTTPDWYGFPDLCADGLPAWHESHLPDRGRPAKQLIADPPPWAGPAAYLEKPHSCMTKMDFCRTEAFGRPGRLFVSEWGTLAPMNSPDPDDLRNGFKVITVDVASGTAEDFVTNAEPGPASMLGTGGIERPVDCKFAPDGSLYVLDFGLSPVDVGKHVSYGHTGVLWRVSRHR